MADRIGARRIIRYDIAANDLSVDPDGPLISWDDFEEALDELANVEAERDALAAQVNAPRGTSAQIQNERSITADSIDGAIAFGLAGVNPPPSDDHWLAPWWKRGREMAELAAQVEGLRADAARYRVIAETLPTDEFEEVAHTVACDQGARSKDVYKKTPQELLDFAVAARKEPT